MTSSDYATEIIIDTTPDGVPCVLVSHPELPGCMSSGWTIEEALENLTDATKLYLEDLKARGLQPPKPARRTGAHSRGWMYGPCPSWQV